MKSSEDQLTGQSVNWVDALHQEDERDRRDYYVRLITLLSLEVSSETMEEIVAKALPNHGVKRGEPHD